MTNSAHDGRETGGNMPAQADGAGDLREKLAELEHEQWCAWSRTLAATESLGTDRLAEWSKLWVPYAELSEADKDLDRKYADRVLAILETAGLEPKSAASRGKQR